MVGIKLIDKMRLVFADSEYRYTVFNSFVALFLRLLSACTILLFNLLIAKKFGAEQAGFFFIALSVVMILSSFSQRGFDTTVLRFVGANSHLGFTIKTILKFTLTRVAAISVSIVLILYVVNYILVNAYDLNFLSDTLIFLLPSVIGLSGLVVISMSFQARSLLRLSIPCQNIVHFVLCSLFIFTFSIEDIYMAAFSFSVACLISFIFFFIISIISLNNEGNEVNKHELLISSNPNWVISLMSQVVQWSTPILIGFWVAADDVAFFAVAQRVALLTTFILMAINLVVAPRFSEFHSKRDFKKLKKTAVFSVRLLIISAIPIVSLMLVFPKELLGLFGAEFEKGAVLLQILVLGQAINVVTGSVGYLLTMSGYEKDMRLITIITGCSMIVFIPIITLIYGVIGAAIITATCIAMQNLLAVHYVNKRLGINVMKFWQKI
jgi:O-antigen/teichoic acid export membrane protein